MAKEDSEQTWQADGDENREEPTQQQQRDEEREEVEKAGINPQALDDDKELKEAVEDGKGVEADGDGDGKGSEGGKDGRHAAASVLQRRYRTYQKQREQSGMNLSSSARWNDALKNERMKESAADAGSGGKNDPSTRWQRGGFYAGRLVEGGGAGTNDDGGSAEPEEEDKGMAGNEGGKSREDERKHKEKQSQKQMDAKYWLEMVDTKHRYASNLNSYHEYWNRNYDGDQNFFYWLDEGEGKDLDLEDSCPRSRLESERILYLTAEQRLNYLVRVGKEGKLVWARDNRPVDTSKGRHKDLGDGRGIVDATDQELQAAKERGELQSDSSSSSSSSSSDSEANSAAQEEGAHHYGAAKADGPLSKKEKMKDKYSLKPKHVMDRLLRKTLNANTWIFVCDLKGNLYVGIKQTGRFQHSSFLFGSRVMAAGLIKVRDGQLTSLSPLSGHYRAGTAQFKGFVERLEEAGCDMSKVSISKSLFIIGGIEKYARFSKRKSKLVKRVKGRFVHPSKGYDEKEDKSDQQRDDERLNDQVESDRKQEKRQHGEVASRAGTQEHANLEREKRGGGPSALPFEGKKLEEMTYEQRIERGAALMVRATKRGLQGEGDGKPSKQDSVDSKKSLAISPDADQALADAKKEREDRKRESKSSKAGKVEGKAQDNINKVAQQDEPAKEPSGEATDGKADGVPAGRGDSPSEQRELASA